jgi:invasion protein IalB
MHFGLAPLNGLKTLCLPFLFAWLAVAGGAAQAVEASQAAATAPVKIKRTEIIAADNWTVTCTLADQPNAKRRCSAELRIAQTESNGQQRVVFTWIMAMQEGKATSVVSSPTGVLMGPGVQVKIGDKETKTITYSLCQPDHCESIFPLDEATTKALLGSQSADFSIVAVTGSPVKFTATLKGIDEALSIVTKG